MRMKENIVFLHAAAAQVEDTKEVAASAAMDLEVAAAETDKKTEEEKIEKHVVRKGKGGAAKKETSDGPKDVRDN